MDSNDSSRLTDSAGVPWKGRSFEQNSFASDDGSAPSDLVNAIKSFQAGESGADYVVDIIRTSRLLVPLVAHLGESELGAHDVLVDKSAELAIVTVKSPDEQDALVVFSSVQAMAAWNPSARPVPTDAVRVALAAASQIATRVVLDPGSPTEFVLRRPVIAKIAQRLPWLPPEQNTQVREVIERSFETESEITDFELATGDPTARLTGPELLIKIRIVSGLDPEKVRALIERVSQRWSGSESFASSVDSVSVKLVS